MRDNTLASLVVNCSLKDVHLLDLYIENCKDEHSFLYVSLEMPEGVTDSEVNGLRGSDFSIAFSDGESLFHGYCVEVAVDKQGDYRIAKITVSAYTKKADTQVFNITYQDSGKTLEKVADIAFRKYGAYISSEARCPIPFVVYQQKETDWGFVKRLSNQFGMSLYTNVKGNGLQFSIGVCGGHYQEEILVRRIGLSKNIEELRNVQGNISADAASYQFLVEKYECKELSAIAGETVGKYLIFKNQLINDGGILRNYIFVKRAADVRPLCSNVLQRSCVSMILSGTVSGVDGNNIQVELDTDSPEMSGGCVSVPYESSISNSFYCMPDIDDQVFLYYENNGSIVCLGSKRKNTDGEDFKKPEEKVLNNHDQMLRFTDTAVIITNTRKKHDAEDTAEITIAMDDEDGITITSGNDVLVETTEKGNIYLATNLEEDYLQKVLSDNEHAKEKFKEADTKGYEKYLADGGRNWFDQALIAGAEEWIRLGASLKENAAGFWDEITLKELRNLISRKKKLEGKKPEEIEVEEIEPYEEGVVTIYGLNSVTLQVGDSMIIIDCDVFFGADVFKWLGYERGEHETICEEFQDWFDMALDGIQLALDICGMIPGIGLFFDLGSAVLSIARGDIVGGLFSVVCAIPGIGDACAAAKIGVKAYKEAAKAVKAGKALTKIAKISRVTKIIYNGVQIVNSSAGITNIILDFHDDGIDLKNPNDWKKLFQIGSYLVGIASSAKDIGEAGSELKSGFEKGPIDLSSDSSDDHSGSRQDTDSAPSHPDDANAAEHGPTANAARDGGTTPDTTSRTNDGGGTESSNRVTVADPINTATGSLTAEQVDLGFEDILGTYSLRRVYESVYNNRGGILGNKWRFEVESTVKIQGNQAVIQMPDLHLEQFEKENGVWQNQRKDDEKLVFCETESGYSLKIQDKAEIYEYDRRGNLSAVFDVHGNKTSFVYSNNCLTRIETVSGLWVAFDYSGKHLSKLEDSLGRTVEYEYTGDYLRSVKMPNGGIMYYEYTPEGFLTKMTDLNGKWLSRNYYDRKGRVIRQELAGGEEFVAFYDEKNKQNTFLTTSTGENVIYQYNSDNLITQALYPDSTSEIKRYDNSQHLVYLRNRMGHESYAEYNAAGLKIYEKNPEGLETRFEYDALNLPIRIWNTAGAELVQKYDECGNLLECRQKIDEKQWQKTSYTYDSKGRVLTKTDANGNVHAFQYDTLFSGPSKYVMPDGAIINYVYNEAGQLIKQTDAYGTTTYGYNVMGHRTMEQDAEGNTTRYVYDKMANLTRVIPPQTCASNNEEGPCTTYGYDVWTHLSKVVTAEFGVWLYENDYLGNVKCVKNPNETYDPNALGTQFEYDTNHHRTKTIYSDGSVLVEKHDVSGNLISRTLPEQVANGGEGYHYSYDVMNRLTEIRNPLGEVEKRYVYDLHGNVIKEISAKGYLCAATDEERLGTIYEYDLCGRLLKVRKPVETGDNETLYQLNTYEYDAVGNRICEKRFLDYQTKESERGRVNTIRYRYDSMNRLLSVTDSTGANMEYRYNERGQRIMEKRLISKGVWQEWKYDYSASGRMIRKTTSADKEGFGKDYATTLYGYDKNGNMTSIQLPTGNEILREYDVMNRLTAEVHREPKGSIDNRTEYRYDPCGNLTEVICGDGYKKFYKYDGRNRMIQCEDSTGAIEKYGYDRNGKMICQIHAAEYALKGVMAKGWRYTYDPAGRELATYAPDGSVYHEVKYNQWGEKSYEGNEAGGVYFTYDFGGRRVLVNSKEGRKQEYQYDAAGNIVGLKDGNGAATEYCTDLWGRVTQVKRADGGCEEYGYDFAGNIVLAVDGLKNSVTYRYNSMNLLASRLDAAGAEETYAYDGQGNMVSHRDRENRSEAYQYNMYGAPTLHKAADGSIDESYEYDKFGRLASAVGGGIRYEYRYLPGGKLQEKLARGRTLLYYDYDVEGRCIRQRDLSGKETEYQYDLSGKLTSVLENGRTLAEYQYYGAFPAKVTLGNGRYVTEYGYDGDGNVVKLTSYDKERISETKSGVNAGIFADIIYEYDGNGSMMLRQGLNGKTTYAYDTCRRLVQVEYPLGEETFTYDLAGNRTSRTMGNVTEQYRYDNCNRLIELTQKLDTGCVDHRYHYDGQGNLLEERISHKDLQGNLMKEETGGFHYDAFNRLESVTKDGLEIQRNYYDAEGLRHEMEENGKLVQFLFNKKREVTAEKNAKGQLIRYIRGLGIICSDSEESKSYYHYVSDEEGSVTHILDDDGNILNHYEYDAFGNLTQCEEQVPNRFLYNGEQYDAVTGQYYLRARFYNPVIGRFTQEDTYYGAGLNLYAYCENNPVGYIDPTGHSPEKMNDLYNAYREYRKEHPNAPASEAIQHARATLADGNSTRPMTWNEFQHAHKGEFTRTQMSEAWAQYKAEMGIGTQPVNSNNGVHGNSLDSPNLNHVYVIVDGEGNMVKVGVSGQPLNQNGTSPRANPQVNNFNNNLNMDTHAVIVATGLSRVEALALEQKITDKHGARNGGSMPSVYHQRPGVRVKSIEEYVNLYGESPNQSTGGRY